MQFYEFFIFLLKASFIVIVVLSLVFGVIWPLMHNLKSQSRARSIESPVRYRRPSRPMFYDDEEEIEIPTAGENQVADNRDIVKMALEDPNKTTLLIRNWIQEKK